MKLNMIEVSVEKFTKISAWIEEANNYAGLKATSDSQSYYLEIGGDQVAVAHVCDEGYLVLRSVYEAWKKANGYTIEI